MRPKTLSKNKENEKKNKNKKEKKLKMNEMFTRLLRP